MASIGLRDRVEALERALYAVPQVDCPVRNFFSPGIYAREITIPAGTAITGAAHKLANMAILSKGRMRLATEAGSIEISAPHLVTCRAGHKNAAVALEECVWTNFFPNPTNETDVDLLVEIVSESKACDLIGGTRNKQLAANKAAELEV